MYYLRSGSGMASLRMTFELKESTLQGEKFRAQRTVSTEPSDSRELSAIREYKGQRVVMELKQQEGDRERGGRQKAEGSTGGGCP